MNKHVDLTPEVRIINGRKVSFYSPSQLEIIIPPEKRLKESGNVFEEVYGGIYKRQTKEPKS